MKTQEQLINNIIGQLNGINKMLKSEKDCFQVLIQMKAVRSALGSAMDKYIEANIVNCMKPCYGDKEQKTLKKLLLELTKNN